MGVISMASEDQKIPDCETTFKILKSGSGDREVKAKDIVTVHATGELKNGFQFWCTKDEFQKPFKYQAGVGKVITGWDKGCLGMKLGEERKLTIPYQEGYGSGGFPAWKIPPKTTLVFTLECIKIEILLPLNRNNFYFIIY